VPEFYGGPDAARHPRPREGGQEAPGEGEPSAVAGGRCALDAGLGLLARREHSVAELRTKLAARGYASGDIEGTLEELAQRMLLCDRRFAEAFLRSRAERGQGPLRIRAQLMRRGVRSGLIDAALDGAEADWDQCAQAARRKRFGPSLPAERAEQARQARFLSGRGFSSGQVARALLAERTP